MSKRHRKNKLFDDDDIDVEDGQSRARFDPEMFETPRGKKPKGKHRREAHKQKRAYYDD